MSKNNETVDRIQAVWNMIGGDDVIDKLIAGTAKLTVEIVRHLTKLTTDVVKGKRVNLLDFFKTRKGLWVSDNFQKFILAAATDGVVETGDTEIAYADLEQRANDAEIKGELSKGYVFEDVNDFLGHLASMVDNQFGGKKDGVLLNTGYRANIFYVKGVNGETFAVFVYWRSDGREWNCNANRLGDNRWNAGHRAFSATAA